MMHLSRSNRCTLSCLYLFTAAVWVIAAICGFYAIERVSLLMQDPPFDHAIFTQAGHDFWRSGQFYPRVNEPYPTFLPGAAVFKFPPVYQLFIAPWVKDGITANYYRASYLFCLFCYTSGILLLCRFILQKNAQPALSVTSCFKLCMTGLIIAIACVFEPFFNGFMLLVGEIPIFFCCVLTLTLLDKKPAQAGACLALATTTKLYPVFMLLYAMSVLTAPHRNRFMAGFFAGAILLGTMTLLVFGWQEPLYYLTHILPTLLQEHPMGISENMSVIFFFFPDGITHVFAENVFLAIRLLTLGTLGWMVFRYRRYSSDNDALLYGLFITSMIICLANYWIQYEVLLLIPALLALITSLQRRQTGLFSCAAVVLLVLASSNELHDTLLQSALLENYSREELTTALQTAAQEGRLPSLWETSRAAFIVKSLASVKPLTPYALWIVTACLLLTRRPHSDR